MLKSRQCCSRHQNYSCISAQPKYLAILSVTNIRSMNFEFQALKKKWRKTKCRHTKRRSTCWWWSFIVRVHVCHVDGKDCTMYTYANDFRVRCAATLSYRTKCARGRERVKIRRTGLRTQSILVRAIVGKAHSGIDTTAATKKKKHNFNYYVCSTWKFNNFPPLPFESCVIAIAELIIIIIN